MDQPIHMLSHAFKETRLYNHRSASGADIRVTSMSSAFAFFLRSVCTTGRLHQLHSASDEFICLCFLETGNYLSVPAFLRRFSLHLAVQGSRSSSAGLYAPTVHSALHSTQALLRLLGLPAAAPIPAPFALLDSSSPSFFISLVRRLCISTVFPKNQLLSQLSFLSCHSLSLTSTPCMCLHTCVHANAEQEAGNAHTTPLSTGGEHARDGDP